MSAAPLEVRYWEERVSIGADRPWNIVRYRHLHRAPSLLVFAAALLVNLAGAMLLTLSARPPAMPVASALAGHPNGHPLEVYFVIPTPAQTAPRRSFSTDPVHQRPDTAAVDRPQAVSVFAPQPAVTGEALDVAALRGIYRRQLQARLERTRERPTAMGATLPSPHCRVLVEQDASGRIVALRILTCTGSWAWQDALLSSIRSAAPLPLPPQTDLLSNRIEIEVADEISVRLLPADEASGESAGASAAVSL